MAEYKIHINVLSQSISESKSNTALATSVIAICAVGFVDSGVYNSPRSKRKRCTNFYCEQLKKGQSEAMLEEMNDYEWKLSMAWIYKRCLEQARRLVKILKKAFSINAGVIAALIIPTGIIDI